METEWKFLKKLKIELLYDPEIILLGIYPEELKSESGRDTCGIIHNRQDMEAT